MVATRAEQDAGPLATSISTRTASSSSAAHSISTKTNQLPAWVQAAMEQEKLSQPWKQHAGAAERDDPDFAQSRDTVTFYDDKIKVCYGEGSMAA